MKENTENIDDLLNRIKELEQENRDLKKGYTRTGKDVISSVKVENCPGHDVVKCWNRGGFCGELTVVKGDGLKIADAFDSKKSHLRIEPARESHLLASVHVVRVFDNKDREGVWVSVKKIGRKNDEDHVDLEVASVLWDEDLKIENSFRHLVRVWPNRPWDHTGKLCRIEKITRKA